MTAFSDETGRGVLESQQHIVEGIILRCLHDKRIEGYTLEMSKEIVSALSASPVAQEPVATKKVYIKPLRTIVEIQTAYADQIRDWLNTATPPAPARVSADEIARIIDPDAFMDASTCDWRAPSERQYLAEIQPMKRGEAMDKANAILALLSRAGDQK